MMTPRAVPSSKPIERTFNRSRWFPTIVKSWLYAVAKRSHDVLENEHDRGKIPAVKVVAASARDIRKSLRTIL